MQNIVPSTTAAESTQHPHKEMHQQLQLISGC